MSKRRKSLVAHPDQGAFIFECKIESYQTARQDILEACQQRQPHKQFESREEACIEIAASCKRAQRQGDMSREQLVDGINDYFGPSKKKLSIHMLNNYFSKPVQYPIPAYLILAIQHVCQSLEPTKTLAEPEDARVISGAEVRQMTLGKIDETISELQRLKKELKNG